MPVYRSGDSEIVRDFIRHPGWRVLLDMVGQLEQDAQNRVVTVASEKDLEEIRLAAGRLIGVQDVRKALSGMEEESGKIP